VGKAKRATKIQHRTKWWARREARLCPPYATIELERHMAYKNFKIETDADGIALVTWDTPGRSMNVLDETSVNELEAIVKETTADAAVKGVVITSGKEALSAGADLSMLQDMSRTYAEVLEDKGEVAANRCCSTRAGAFLRCFVPSKPQASRGLPRSTGLRSAAASS